MKKPTTCANTAVVLITAVSLTLVMQPAIGQHSYASAISSNQAWPTTSITCHTTGAVPGEVRWNTDTKRFETWNETSWQPIENNAAAIADDNENSLMKLNEQTKLTATGGSGSRDFGHAVHMNGNMAIVGAPNYNKTGSNTSQGAKGLAFVFARNGANWNQVAVLSAADGANGDQFGVAVAISGNTAIVGAKQATVSGKKWQGAAYVFTSGRGGWLQQAKLTANDGANGDFFGSAVALEGNTALVAAPKDDIGNAKDRGSVYTFNRNGTTWTQQTKLTASDGTADDQFGHSVSADGMYMVVGAAQANNGKDGAEGAAYVFMRDGLGWVQSAKLLASGAQSEGFGYSVSISGQHIIVGSLHDANGPGLSTGAAYIFVRDGQDWTQQVRLTTDDAASSKYFGMSVSINGDYAIVGSTQNDIGVGYPNTKGSAYVYFRTGFCWKQQAVLTASDAATDDWFGFSVSISGSQAIVGAIWHDAQGKNDQGAAYVFQTNWQRRCD